METVIEQLLHEEQKLKGRIKSPHQAEILKKKLCHFDTKIKDQGAIFVKKFGLIL